MSANKLCKDCRHFAPDTVSWDASQFQQKYAICKLTSRVTGLDGDMCLTKRTSFFDGCGKAGKLWEAA